MAERTAVETEILVSEMDTGRTELEILKIQEWINFFLSFLNFSKKFHFFCTVRMETLRYYFGKN